MPYSMLTGLLEADDADDDDDDLWSGFHDDDWMSCVLSFSLYLSPGTPAELVPLLEERTVLPQRFAQDYAFGEQKKKRQQTSSSSSASSHILMLFHVVGVEGG